MTQRILIAGTNSGVGKTTITMGLIAALKQRGLVVQPFKAGPDYIDPTYHTLAAGRPCRNIDTWMVPPERAFALFQQATQPADMAVIEGVMGLFDGFSYTAETGSTAEISKLMNAPVLLVLDVGKMARSAGALALGYTQFDAKLKVSGFILNNVGSENHFQGVKLAVEQATGVPVLGGLPKHTPLHIPERHLGLVPTNERGQLTEFINHAATVINQQLDIDRLLHITETAPPLPLGAEEKFPPLRGTKGGKNAPHIAIARDEAFSFYYEDNLDLLRRAGAELIFFSPLHDDDLPPGINGLYIGGGFPEVYAESLAANLQQSALKQSLHQAYIDGMPIYAECGGLMYLSQTIVDLAGQDHPMVGLIPGVTEMQPRLTSLGYRLVESPTDNFLLPAGATTRGHEFHWSRWQIEGDHPPAWQIQPRRQTSAVRPDGYARRNLIASYVHLHFAHDLQLAANFVRACRQWSSTNAGNAP